MIVMLLASHSDERQVREFWKHLAALRRQVAGVTWATVYVEDMAQAQALVPVQNDECIVVGCLSHSFLSALFDEPAVREVIESAYKKIPFILSPCAWDEWPSPFEKKFPLVPRKVLSEVGSRQIDTVLAEGARRLREILLSEVA